jgi:fused signal recognition particle receptor
MFPWLKKKKSSLSPAALASEAEKTISEASTHLEAEIVPPVPEADSALPIAETGLSSDLEAPPAKSKTGLFAALRAGLKRTRTQFTEGMATLLLGKKKVDAALLAQIETQLLLADVGVAATQRLIADMTARVQRNALSDSGALYAAIQEALCNVLLPSEVPWVIPTEHTPYVIFMVGVNGAGKTTTIGKLAKQLQESGKSVLLAAGDTFRAAAVQQLKVWGERNAVGVIAQHEGADSASVIFDALSAARARKIDVLIADTAGRLHTQTHLMDELKKIKRVMAKLDPTAPHETMLVIDAGVGQNALRQAEEFHAALSVNSLVITKLDGTAKGGTVFSLAENLHLPIRFIGVGEGIEDLQPFHAKEFVQALFN